jgi:hypothetical protein
MLSNLTYKVVAYGYVDWLNSDEVIDWAFDMLDLNFTVPSLYIIASIEKSSPFYEVIPYLEDAINELGLKRKTEEEALVSYSRFYVNQIANQQHVRQNIKLLSELCIHEDYADQIYDFYNLHFAWMDYEYDPNYPFSHYWEGATAKNIERKCIEHSERWLAKYEEQYKQTEIKLT